MRKSMLLAAAAISLPATVQAAPYLPFGAQQNVAVSTVTSGGWSQCYSAPYGNFGTSIASILSGCNASASGTRLMLAGRATNSSTLLLLGQALATDVTFDTGFGNTTHNANGLEWYFSDSFSWGFAPGGSIVNRRSCDTVDSTFFGNDGGNGSTIDQRLCWHTGGGNMRGGWRLGALDFLTSSNDYEKVIYTFTGNAAVPEPATWALMIGGFGMVGGAMRYRRRKTMVTFA